MEKQDASNILDFGSIPNGGSKIGIMKVYIKDTNETSLFLQARSGFMQMGYEIYMYKQFTQPIEPDSIAVGYISDISELGVLMGFAPIQQLDYPASLSPYLYRTITETTTLKLPTEYPFFIKPKSLKSFSGRVVHNFQDLIGLPDTKLYYTEDILDIVSEFRCYILHNYPIAVKHYKGSPYYCLSKQIVLEMVSSFTNSPKAYSMDIGITRDGTYVLIECNNAYSSGNYGMSDLLYAKFLRQGYIDICKCR